MTENTRSETGKKRTNNDRMDYTRQINNAGQSSSAASAAAKIVNGARQPVPKEAVRKKKSKKSNFPPNKTVVEVQIYKEGIDRLFFMLVIIMICLGTIMIFSASYANALEYYKDSYFFLKKQLKMAAIGFAAMMFTAYFVNYRFIKKLAAPFFIGILALNYATGILGKITHGAQRWLFGFQPSEFLKLAVVLFLASYIAQKKDKMKKIGWGIIVPLIIMASIAGAMWMQSHLSGLIILMLICVGVMFIGEAPIGFFIGSTAIVFAVVTYILKYTQNFADFLIDITKKEYAANRILAWINPFKYSQDEGYQIIQSLYAIGSGGVGGLGWGQSRQKFLYLPEPQNDFIFSIICEEMGFIGATIIIILFVALIWRGFVIALHAPDKFSSVVVMGIMIKVAIQFILNIAVVTNTIPNTGISLPFFSYGGTALIVLMCEMGLVLSISRLSYQEKP